MKNLFLLAIVICNLLSSQWVFADMGRVSLSKPLSERLHSELSEQT